MKSEESLKGDLLRGVPAIAQEIDETERRTYFLLEKGYIPAIKEGRTWVASKSVLRAHYRRLSGAAA